MEEEILINLRAQFKTLTLPYLQLLLNFIMNVMGGSIQDFTISTEEDTPLKERAFMNEPAELRISVNIECLRSEI